MNSLMELSTRTRRTLAGGHRLGWFRHLDPRKDWPEHLLCVPQIGKVTAQEIRDWVARHGGSFHGSARP